MTRYVIDLKELVSCWDYNKNVVDIKEATISSRKKYFWICPKGHSYEQDSYSKSTGIGCPYCSGNKVLKGYNDLATTNPDVLNEWDYKKNNDITPFNISYGSTKKVWWVCPKGHEYNISPAQKIRCKVICPVCSNQKVLKGYNDFATKHPKL